MRWGVVTFPGSNDDHDALFVAEHVLGDTAVALWHKDRDLQGVDCVILPGGFSYGDYLRCGAMARFSPIMQSVGEFARDGGYVMAICNGFQIACEAGLLPGALIRNQSLRFICADVPIRVERGGTSFTNQCRAGDVLTIAIKHGEGAYVADPATLARLEEEGRVLFRYVDASGRATAAGNPNGSANNIAGIMNRAGNVLGMMPHPEHACEKLLGNDDAVRIFRSVAEAARRGRVDRRSAVVAPGH